MNEQSPAGPAETSMKESDRPSVTDLLQASVVGAAGLFGAIALGVAIAMS